MNGCRDRDAMKRDDVERASPGAGHDAGAIGKESRRGAEADFGD